MNDKNVARLFKNQILENLHQIDYLKKSSSFFYNLVCRLTESYRHDQYNFDAHLGPFCSKDQILNLLSHWSIEYIEQIDSSSLFRSKLIYYQPFITIHLIQCDLNEKKKNNGTFSNYFQRKRRTIKYQTFWDIDGSDLDAFIFPRSFSLDYYSHLSFALYDSSRKQRKWLFDIVINEQYGEITTPFSLHLIFQYKTNKAISVKQRLSLIRYQLMTQDSFDQFLILFNQTSSNVHQREQNYILFLQCAFSINDEQVRNILQWIQKRFTNERFTDERLTIIETFLRTLSEYNNRVQIKILSIHFETIEAIIELALNHLDQSQNTLQIIVNYGLFLLHRVEYHPNTEQVEQIEILACKIIKR
ncbi:unnamed protein product [Rotaria sp. Silwood2]|nr:unnamed protein product [Rotaria sp. Silwood2]CAF4235285.1 unnamed protein product [Rotaria sp. Silwood2]